jgi:hypothetical protein
MGKAGMFIYLCYPNQIGAADVSFAPLEREYGNAGFVMDDCILVLMSLVTDGSRH